jgi:hypothetical protein
MIAVSEEWAAVSAAESSQLAIMSDHHAELLGSGAGVVVITPFVSY